MLTRWNRSCPPECERQVTELVEHDHVEPRELDSQGPGLADPGLFFEPVHRRQLVVAGDPKQMPPTSFFDRGASAEDDDSEVESDQESILEECLGARLPQRRLTWNYAAATRA